MWAGRDLWCRPWRLRLRWRWGCGRPLTIIETGCLQLLDDRRGDMRQNFWREISRRVHIMHGRANGVIDIPGALGAGWGGIGFQVRSGRRVRRHLRHLRHLRLRHVQTIRFEGGGIWRSRRVATRVVRGIRGVWVRVHGVRIGGSVVPIVSHRFQRERGSSRGSLNP